MVCIKHQIQQISTVVLVIMSAFMSINCEEEELKYATGTIQVGNFNPQVSKCTQALTQTCQQIFIGQGPTSQVDCKSKPVTSSSSHIFLLKL